MASRGPRRNFKPGQPREPKHNDTNRMSQESRTRDKMLDQSKEHTFRYYGKQIFAETGVGEDRILSLLQTIWAKGTRDNVKAARAFIAEKVADGTVPADAQKRIDRLIEDVSTWR